MPPHKSRKQASDKSALLEAPTPLQVHQMHENLERMSILLAVPVLKKGTKEQIKDKINTLSSGLDSIGLEKTPMLGPRYGAHFDYIHDLLDDASAALKEDDNARALSLYNRAREHTSRLAAVFKVETAIIENGVPEGLPKRITLNGILNAVEASLMDKSPQRERANTILTAATLYAKNADVYNSDNPIVRKERNALFDFILEMGAASRAGGAYSDKEKNLQFIASFKVNASVISNTAREIELALVKDWRKELSRQIPLVKSPAIKSMLKKFDKELEKVTKHLDSGKRIHGAEFAELKQRFYALTGTVPPVTPTMRMNAIYERANGLVSGHGSKSTYAPAWYGKKAREALGEGNFHMASLAVSIGMLERAAGGKYAGSRYLPVQLHKEIRDAITHNTPIKGPAMEYYLSQIRSATIHAECDRMESEAPVVGTTKRRDMANLIHNAVAEIRRRASVGDMKSAQRLFEMTDGYERLIKSNGWNAWPGSSEIESALGAELAGKNGTAKFEQGLAFQSFSGTVKEFKSTLARWGKGLSPQKEVLDEALTKIQELAHEGRFAEARRLLTYSVMYADGVVRLSTGARGSPTALDPHVTPETLEKMESAISSLVSGNENLHGTDNEKLFMEGYSECMQTYITLQASSLALLTRSRPVGQKIISAALNEARSRGLAGDFRGATTLLAYVEDFYGAATKTKTAGWRYAQFDASYLRDAEGIVLGRDGILEAIEHERRASSAQDHASAEKLFSTSIDNLNTTTNLIYQAAMIRHRYMGKSPIVPGDESTKDVIPFGSRGKNGKYQYSLPLKSVREYESTYKNDPALGHDPTLKSLLRSCMHAARSGDVEKYNTAVRAFNMRFELVVGRVAADQTYAEAIEKLDELDLGLNQMTAVKGLGPERLRALRELIVSTAEMREALETARDAHEKFPSTKYLALLADVASERRLVMGISTISQQIKLGDQYLKCVRAEGGEIRDLTVEHLEASRKHLVRTRQYLASGNKELAMKEYTMAINRRISALVTYRADNAVVFKDVVGAHRRRLGTMPDLRFFPVMRLQKQYDDFKPYLDAHTSLFNDMLSGKPVEKIETAGRGTMLIETSIFGVPADAPSQFFDSFAREQSDIRNFVAHGDLASAEQVLNKMLKRAEDNRWVANVAVMGVGLASAFIPVVGIWVSGGIFTGIAVDRIVTETRRDGHASAEAWMMLGLTVATVGLAGAAIRTARLARAATTVGQSTRAARLSSVSAGFTYANLGIGSFMVGYMGTATWHTYEQYLGGKARLRDVILSAGMTLFPVVHMSVAGVRSYYGRMAASRAGQTLPTDPTIGPESGPKGRLKPTELPAPDLTTPEAVFAFMRALAGADKGARAVANARLARLPSAVRATIEGWMGKPGVVRSALEAGSINDLALHRIKTGIENFRPHLETGISGTPVQNDIIRLTDYSNLSGLIKDLLTPDIAVKGRGPRARRALAARDAARFTLERIRTENPEAARYIDMILGNEGYHNLRAELVSGRPLSPASKQTLRNTSVLIGETLPENMRPWAMSIAVNDVPRTAEAIGSRRGIPTGTETLQPRASAQGGGKKGPSAGAVRPPLQERQTVQSTRKGTSDSRGSKSRRKKPSKSKTRSKPLAEVKNNARTRKLVRSLDLDPIAKETAIKNINDDSWAHTTDAKRIGMNQNRAATRAEMEQYFESAASELGWSKAAIKEYSDAFISLLDVSERNGYTTYGHTLRVAQHTDKMLNGMEMSPVEKAKIRMAALIHDVGKIAVSNDMWRISGKPTSDQTATMETHAQQSGKIANALFEKIGLVDEAQFQDIARIAECHQEYFDGTRYGGLKGNETPLGSRILSLADSFDAMRSDRSYREGLSSDAAIGQIRRYSGEQFDPELVPLFIEAVKE